jgi:malate dehydrogenase (oxaloacetate-decarboxylating)(NADP+)
MAYGGKRLSYGPDYIVPTPFDPRLILAVAPAVAQAAMESGVARKPISDMEAYRDSLRERVPASAGQPRIHGMRDTNPKFTVLQKVVGE